MAAGTVRRFGVGCCARAAEASHREVVESLVAAGPTVEPKMLEEKKVPADREAPEALTSRGPRPKDGGR